MAVGVQVWSQTPASNATADSNINYAEGMAPSALNDSNRSLMASVARWNNDNNGTLATSGTSAAFTLVTNQVESALTAGFTVAAQFHIGNDASATLAVDGLTAKPLQIYPGVALTGYELGGGSVHRFTYSTTGTGQWIRQSPPAFTVVTATLGADATTATTAYVDGPSVTLGTSGVWYVSSNITLKSATSQAMIAKLWDGTTVIDSVRTVQAFAASQSIGVSLSGIITNPAAAVKVSYAPVSAGVSCSMCANFSGESKDSTVTAVRIG